VAKLGVAGCIFQTFNDFMIKVANGCGHAGVKESMAVSNEQNVREITVENLHSSADQSSRLPR